MIKLNHNINMPRNVLLGNMMYKIVSEKRITLLVNVRKSPQETR